MKKIEDYLHLYLGCEVEYGSEDDKKIGVLTGVDSFQVYTANIKLAQVPVQLVRLILRPVSTMTEDEMKDLYHINYMYGNACTRSEITKANFSYDDNFNMLSINYESKKGSGLSIGQVHLRINALTQEQF